jgi:hypothetical protein
MRIAPDKWKHFFVGILIGAALQAFCWWLLPDLFLLATLITLILVICISYGWELISRFTGKGHYEISDAIASIVGGLLGMGITMLLGYFLIMRPGSF